MSRQGVYNFGPNGTGSKVIDSGGGKERRGRRGGCAKPLVFLFVNFSLYFFGPGARLQPTTPGQAEDDQ